MRAGIPYGPEGMSMRAQEETWIDLIIVSPVSAQEARTNTTISERGLAFGKHLNLCGQQDIKSFFQLHTSPTSKKGSTSYSMIGLMTHSKIPFIPNFFTTQTLFFSAQIRS